jgi:SAM-dependent methyltransferase
VIDISGSTIEQRSADTPARHLGAPLCGGCHWLSNSDVGHFDGGESEVEAIIAAGHDLRALSDELPRRRGTWTARYHLARERGNILRPLSLQPDFRILEIGAGCGAVTRYLGETCATVDALEPTPQRASIARLRTRDLSSVEIFVGELSDIPEEPAYDVVVIVGVLEYVGGSNGHEDRVEFLHAARKRLRPGGNVVCAIENRLGVQYLAGAPEEHVAAAFEGLEGYPHQGPARTFSRAEIERLFGDAGLNPTVFGVMPDYKFARLLFADPLLDSQARSLAWSAPTFPSDASPHPRPQLVSELHLWRALVDAGLGGHFANSLLLVASDGDGAPLWPEELLGAFYSPNRLGSLTTESRLWDRDGALSLQRSRLSAGDSPPRDLLHRPRSQRWVAGRPMLDVLERADDAHARILLEAWRSLVESDRPEDGARNIDLVPANIVIRADGCLEPIDQEWYHSGYSPQDVVARGILTLSIVLASRVPQDRWPEGCETVRDVVSHVGSLTGDTDMTMRLPEILERESALVALITGDEQAVILEDFVNALDLPLADTPFGLREPELRLRADLTANAARARAVELERQVVELSARLQENEAARRQLENSHAELARIHTTIINSKSWRLAMLARRAGAGLRAIRP